MAKTIEEICISKVKAGIRSIKNQTKTPKQAKVGYFLNRLRDLNEGMYRELLEQYTIAYNKWKNK